MSKRLIVLLIHWFVMNVDYFIFMFTVFLLIMFQVVRVLSCLCTDSGRFNDIIDHSIESILKNIKSNCMKVCVCSPLVSSNSFSL